MEKKDSQKNKIPEVDPVQELNRKAGMIIKRLLNFIFYLFVIFIIILSIAVYKWG